MIVKEFYNSKELESVLNGKLEDLTKNMNILKKRSLEEVCEKERILKEFNCLNLAGIMGTGGFTYNHSSSKLNLYVTEKSIVFFLLDPLDKPVKITKYPFSEIKKISTKKSSLNSMIVEIHTSTSYYTLSTNKENSEKIIETLYKNNQKIKLDIENNKKTFNIFTLSIGIITFLIGASQGSSLMITIGSVLLAYNLYKIVINYMGLKLGKNNITA